MAKKEIAWGSHVTPEFKSKVIRMTSDWYVGADDDLMSCMKFESGLNSKARNPVSSATGLIQFMSATAKSLGTTTAALYAMSPVDQLSYVGKYFQPVERRLTNLEDMYMAILWPKAVGQTISYVLWKLGAQAYAANKALDWNRDGKITKKEATKRVRELKELGLQPGNIG
jgi:hypothetical protein